MIQEDDPEPEQILIDKKSHIKKNKMNIIDHFPLVFCKIIL